MERALPEVFHFQRAIPHDFKKQTTMLLIIIRIVFLMIAAGAIATYVSGSNSPDAVTDHALLSFSLMFLLVLGVLVMDVMIRRKRVEAISAVYFGLLIGVLLSYLLIQAVEPFFQQDLFKNDGPRYRNGVGMMALLILPYLCITFLLQTKDDFRFVIPYVEFSRELKGGRPLIIDSTALIDGRIADLIETKVVDTQLVVPDFVLQELQDIADTGDKVRRGRGRRGLDVLGKIQQNPHAEVRIHETAPPAERSSSSRDRRLVEIAKELSGRVVTNDINLNKVAAVQNVDVINLNDVANALKPRYLPGEQLRIKIIKEGESYGQGVGYLDDGTMVVCEQGKESVGQEIDVEVTSVLQNSAGRMIFGRLPGSVSSGTSGTHSRSSHS